MSDDNCVLKCCRCLANIPCSSMMCWVMIVMTTSACGGALMIAADRTQSLLANEELYWYSDYVCLGTIFGMALFATIFLVLATISSRPLSINVFNSNRKNTCAKVLQIFIILVQFLLLVAWAAATCVLSVPVMLLTLLQMLYYRGDHCIDLSDYALADKEETFCGSALTTFVSQSNKAFECYVIALVAALLVVLSLVFHLMCTVANFIHLREAAPSEYSVYQNEIAQSKNSVLDTRM